MDRRDLDRATTACAGNAGAGLLENWTSCWSDSSNDTESDWKATAGARCDDLLDLPDNDLWDIVSGRRERQDCDAARLQSEINDAAELRADGYRLGEHHEHDKNATLKLPDGKTLEFPVLTGTIGPDVVDIRTLYGKTGMFTYDPGFLSTASCSSAITYIDGDKGVLLYRGYPIEQLAAELRLPRGLLPAAERRAAQPGAERRVRRHGHAPHHGARAAERASSRASAATRTRWR